MREIKFRAWNNKTRSMTYYHPLAMADDGLLACVDEGSCPESYIDTHGGVPDPNIIIEQCTGLKDKNGQDIYEGDIINHYGVGMKEIAYDVDQAMFVMVNYTHSVSNYPFCYNFANDSYVVDTIHTTANPVFCR